MNIDSYLKLKECDTILFLCKVKRKRKSSFARICNDCDIQKATIGHKEFFLYSKKKFLCGRMVIHPKDIVMILDSGS